MSNDLEKERLTTLAQELALATAQRAARWELRDADFYSWTAPEGAVTIASRDRDGEPPYELTVYNSGAEKVDELVSELLVDDEPAPWNEPLAELYRIARRSGLGADDIIDALLDRLREADGDARTEQRSFLGRARAGSASEST
jgi:hypothetical protein